MRWIYLFLPAYGLHSFHVQHFSHQLIHHSLDPQWCQNAAGLFKGRKWPRLKRTRLQAVVLSGRGDGEAMAQQGLCSAAAFGHRPTLPWQLQASLVLPGLGWSCSCQTSHGTAQPGNVSACDPCLCALLPAGCALLAVPDFIRTWAFLFKGDKHVSKCISCWKTPWGLLRIYPCLSLFSGKWCSWFSCIPMMWHVFCSPSCLCMSPHLCISYENISFMKIRTVKSWFRADIADSHDSQHTLLLI